ncbi:MAG: prepilin-type N-terminal cleavage/methylation domain-containing protein [Christensenellales bacterium]
MLNKKTSSLFMTKHISVQISDKSSHHSFKILNTIFSNRRQTCNKATFSPAFTIVELLVVIVVIGILATITIVAYSGISQRAIVTSLTSDLTNAATQLKLFQVDNSAFPTTIDCAQPDSATNKCLKTSSGNTFTYFHNNSINPPTFILIETNSNGTSYNTTDSSQPIAGIGCSTGFIVVPGSSTYSTNDFCVMKYEAKNDGLGKAVSVAAGTPWVNVSQATVSTIASAACLGCHLITEAEWMTIAQNVLGVASNWSGGTVGSGYIYKGHNDNVPANALAADPSDTNGYAGTGDTAPSSQRRTLTLTNGEVIWDLAGNVFDLINATIAGNAQPGLSGESAYAYKQWNDGSLLQNGLPSSSMPASTGIAGISGWNSTQGIGGIYSNYGETVAKALIRGGWWNYGNLSGVLSLNMLYSPPSGFIGFRVSR